MQVLDITIANFVMRPHQAMAIGALALEDLRLTSQVYKKQPSLSRLCCSHLDDDGVKALVDAICQRCAHFLLPSVLHSCPHLLVSERGNDG